MSTDELVLSATTGTRWLQVVRALGEIFEEQNKAQERQKLIGEIDQAILRSTFSAQEVLKLIVDKCLNKVEGGKQGQVVEYRHNELIVVHSTNTDYINQTLPLNNSLCGKAVLSQQTQHIKNVNDLPENEYVRFNKDTQSELAVLIKAADSGRILGVLNIERNKPGLFDQDSIAFAELLAGQAAIAIRHAQTWSGVRMLYEINTSVLSGDPILEESFQKILRIILDIFDFQYGQILLVEHDNLVVAASSDNTHIGTMATRENSICGKYLLAEGNTDILVINNIECSKYNDFYLGLLTGAAGRPMRSEMVVPLIHGTSLIGALNIEDPRVDIFSELEKKLLPVVASLIASAISATFSRRKQANEERINAANLALTELGHETENFVHPFNNRIGSARGKLIELNNFLSLLQLPALPTRDKPVPQFISEVIENLTEAIEKLKEFMEQFNPDSPRYKFENMDIKDVVEKCIVKAKAKYAAEDIEFTFQSGRSNSKTGGEEYRHCLLSELVFEVIGSILDNSAEAIQERDPGFKGKINLTLEATDPYVARLQIRDNGVGIPDENKSKIFEHKFTTKTWRASAGKGLWFCDLYMRQRGGSISLLESKVGVGSCFELFFPTINSEILSGL